jgi:HlyD family secretion protein
MNASIFETAGEPGSVAIPLPRRRLATRFLLPIMLVIATVGLILGASWRSLIPVLEVSGVPVVVKSVDAPVGGSSLTATGWIEPDPYPTHATPLVQGVVSTVEVLEGDEVVAGDVLARLIDEDARIALDAALAQLRVAEGEHARARAQLNAAETEMSTLVLPTQQVEIAAAKVKQAEAALAGLASEEGVLRAEAAALRDELDRKSPLVEAGAAGAGEVARLGLALAAKEASIEKVRAGQAAAGGYLEESVARLRAAEEARSLRIRELQAVEVARAEVAKTEGAVALAESRRAAAQLALDRTVIRAPSAGIVLRRSVVPGSPVSSHGAGEATPIAILYDPARLQVRVDIPLADAAGVGRGQAAEVQVSALPDRTFRGRISRLVHEADLQKNTVEVKVAIEDPIPLLKPEMLARVRLLAGEGGGGMTATRERVFAPRDLAASGEAALWVITNRVDGRGTASRRGIEWGAARLRDAAGREWGEVTSGLLPGDILIENPPPDLEEGAGVEWKSGGGR